MEKMNKMLAAILAAALAFILAGCAETVVPERNAETGSHYTASESDDPGSSQETDTEYETEQPDDAVQDPEISVDSNTSDVAPAKPADMTSVDAIAFLGTLEGTGEQTHYENHDIVDVTSSHNTYDLVWQYGDTDLEGRKDFGKLYQSYVDAVDWSLVFDAEYYKQAFPMLAMLYHDDDALLLEHFQTVGVHEGRQASESFNVEAYMSVCDESLRDAFEDNYECYYFYYLMHYDAEKNLDTASVYGEHRLWLSIELTLAQKREVRGINNCRDDVGVDHLKVNPEIIAFANYRAWYNAVNHVAGHGWLQDDDNAEIAFETLNVNTIGENTITKKRGGCMESSLMPYSVSYANSESHYEAMIREDYIICGASHMYCDPDAGWVTQFDAFLTERPSPFLGR